jgi:4a-hydroxytetrahydrobiopterin dehydratase
VVRIVTQEEFQARSDLPDWRYTHGRIEACYRCGTFAAAAMLGAEIAATADRVDHHPDLDVRYPDRLHVQLSTHVVDAVTHADIDLARTVSELAHQRGATSEPPTVSGCSPPPSPPGV